MSICRSLTEESLPCRFRSNGQVGQKSRSDVTEPRQSLTRIEDKHGQMIGSSPSRGAIALSCLAHEHRQIVSSLNSSGSERPKIVNSLDIMDRRS
jgi:hypothetical protein